MDGIEVFYQDDDGEWHLYDETKVEPIDYIENVDEIQINFSGEKWAGYRYKARLYKRDSETGERIYTDFSPVANTVGIG